jgi:hypothetical protein
MLGELCQILLSSADASQITAIMRVCRNEKNAILTCDDKQEQRVDQRTSRVSRFDREQVY